MAKRKYTKTFETPKGYECTKKNCKWQMSAEPDQRTDRSINADVSEKVCPKCGNNKFYGLLEEPEAVLSRKKVTVHVYNDGVTAKWLNKKTFIRKAKPDINEIIFVKAIQKDDDKSIPTCEHSVIKGKIVATRLCLSDEALDILYHIIGRYKERMTEEERVKHKSISIKIKPNNS